MNGNFQIFSTYYIKDDYFTESSDFKGQLNSEGINEVIVSPKMPTKKLKYFCPGSVILQG